MVETHSIEKRALELLKQHLASQGRTVRPSDNKTFDLIVDDRYGELKAKDKPYRAFDFFFMSENQYNAALAGPEFSLFLVCGVANEPEVQIFEIPSTRLRILRPKSEIHYYYDKGLVDQLLRDGNA